MIVLIISNLNYCKIIFKKYDGQFYWGGYHRNSNGDV